MSVPFLSITIGINPEMFSIGSLVLTWHGFFTLVAVALAVYLVSRWAKKEGMDTDAVMMLLTRPVGHLFLGVAAALTAAGTLWAWKIVHANV